MKKRPVSFKIYFISVITILVTSIVVSLFGLSFAAYLNTEKQNQSININMDYSKYFDEENSDPLNKKYAISNSDHLRNLSQLVAIGAFTPDFKFNLIDNITFEGEPLIPIGSDNTPFYSTFDGQGFRISNLAVVGSDLCDVGMFGYVANGAIIKNFLLDYPYVSAKGTYLDNQYTTDAFLIRDNNPFRVKYGKNLDDLAKSVKLEVTDSKNDSTSEFSNFKISYVNNINVPFTVKTYVNKNGYVTTSDGFNFVRDTSYNLASSYFTVEVYIEGLVEINEEYFYSRYTLERFKIYYKTKEDNNGVYTPLGFVQNSGDPKCYRKTIEVPPTHIASGTKTYNYYNQHVVFAGIVCGHLDGQAEYIGVSNGTLYADHRSFRSNSILIGKRIDDDDYSSLSKEYIHVDKANIGQLEWAKPSGYDTGTKNRYISNIYNKENNNNFSESAKNYVRIYGSQEQNNNDGGLRLEQLTIDGVETKTLAFYDSIDCYLTKSSSFLVDLGTNNMFKNNCISMWITMDSTSGFGNVISELLNSSGDFYIKFKFNYVLFDNNNSLSSDNYSDLKVKMFSSTKRSTSSSVFRYYSAGCTDIDGNIRDDNNYYAYGINENSVGDGVTTIRNAYLDTHEYYNSLTFRGDEALPLSTTNISKEHIHEKEIVIVSNPSYFNLDYSIANRTPLFCFGFDIPKDEDGIPTAKINLIDFDVTLSTVKGNYSSEPLSVDYYNSENNNNIPTYSSNSWSNWPKYSNVKVSVNCFSEFVDNSKYDENTDSNGNVIGFTEPYPAMSKIPYIPSTYKIIMTRSNNFTATVNNVTCTYYMGTSSTNNIPINSEGYTEANILAG